MKREPSRGVLDRLRALPVQNQRATVRASGSGTAVVSIPVTYPRGLTTVAKALGLREERSFQLEGVALSFFQRVDGARTVQDHVDWLAREHALGFHEARVLTMKYLETLMARGLVVIVVPAARASATGEGGPQEHGI